MAKPNNNKSEVTKRSPSAPGYSRFGLLATSQSIGLHYVRGLEGRPMRDEKPFERHDAIVLFKHSNHGWVQRTKCQQKWVVYQPVNPNRFRAQETPTLREALLLLSGWLGFNNYEYTTHVLK